MPIYAFRCDACGHTFDRLQKLSDADPETCPACREDAVKRQLTAPAFRLAGSGWYETDFKKEGDKKRNLADTGDAPAKADGDKAASGASDTAKSKDTSAAAKPASGKESGAGKSSTGSSASSAAD